MSTSLVKSSTLTAGIAITLGLGSFIITNPAHASTLNGSFEDNPALTSWMISGDVSRQGTFQGVDSTDGVFQALLTTASTTRLDDFPSAAGTFNFSGDNPTNALSSVDPSNPGSPAFALQDFLGLGPTAFNIPSGLGFDLVAHEGSAIQQTLTVNDGDTIRFDWNFLTNDGNNFLGGSRDYAFVSLYEQGSTPGPIVILAASTGLSGTLGPNFNQQTGYRSFNSGQLTAGEWVLGIGVVDLAGSDNTSALLVDSVTRQSVPEPMTILGSAMAMGVGMLFQRKKSRKKPQRTQ